MLADADGFIVRHLFLHEHLVEGLRDSNGTHGSVRKQGGNSQALGDYRWSSAGDVVHFPLVLLRICMGLGMAGNGLRP